MENETQAKLVLAAGLGLVTVGVGKFVKTLRDERSKRAKIEEWKQMNLSAIEAWRDRVMTALLDPNSTWEEIQRAYKEEAEFVKLINDQPMF